MGLLRRRRKLESVPTSAVPPADGAAPCLDATSRRWATEPIAGGFVDWASADHSGGFGAGYCGVWHAGAPLAPLDRFAIGPAGVLAANLLLRRLELIPRLAARRLPSPPPAARPGDATLLLAHVLDGDGLPT